jgi:phosphatidylinositol glycan class T
MRLSLAALLALPAGIRSYQETLHLRPLPQNALLASFEFKSNASLSSFEQQNFRYLPRSLGQILQHAHTKELHLRFSLGRWDDDTWGARPWDGAREGGTGVELWAWVDAASDHEYETQSYCRYSTANLPRADSHWLTLTNALSGLFCASLNFIDATRTIRPINTFEPEGVHKSQDNLQLLYGTLPHEVVCTENLTPFLKLLPCKGKAGISSLLDGHKLFDATWQTMALDIRPICPSDGGECALEMHQVVAMVLDLDRSKRPRDNPIPRPKPIEEIECDKSKPYGQWEDHCFPLQDTSEPGWSLREVFGRPISQSCSLDGVSDHGSVIQLDVPRERSVVLLSADRPDPHPETTSDNHRTYELPSSGRDFDMILPKQQIPRPIDLASPPLHASRSITGYGQERGGIQTTLSNPNDTPLEVVYLESLPWFMKVYLHTLKASVLGSNGATASESNPIADTYYRPGLDRQRGTHLELNLTIPPRSTVTLTYQFQKMLLRYTEYPPDANRGFDVPSAVIRILNHPSPPGSRDAASSDGPGPKRGTYIRTTPLLLMLPTPDFSMPYNVIILTSTVMALGFGGFFNMMVRRMVGRDEVPPSPLQLALARLRNKLQPRINALVLGVRKGIGMGGDGGEKKVNGKME